MYITKSFRQPLPTIGLFPILCTLFLLLGCFTFSQAQQKPTVIITDFTFNPEAASSLDVDKIYRMIAQYFSETNRFTMINREKWDAILAEKELQKRAEFIDGYMVEQGGALGADIMVFGHLISSEGNLNYASVQLVAIDVASSEEVFNQMLMSNGRSTGGSIDAFEVVDASDNLINGNSYAPSAGANMLTNAITLGNTLVKGKSLQRNVEELIDEYYPLKLYVSKYEGKGNQINEVLLYGTQEYNFKKGQKYTIVESSIIKNPDGSTGVLEEPVAEIKIAAIKGEYASCKVLSGKEELFQKQESKNVYVRFSGSAINLPFGG